MLKVKLTVCRVRYVPDDPRVYVDDKVGDVVEGDAKTLWAMVDANQAVWVGDAPERPDGSDPDPKLDRSDLYDLGIGGRVVVLLMTENVDIRMPAINSISELQNFIDSGGNLTHKKGIGESTAADILTALASYQDQAAALVNEAATDENGEPVLEA